MKVLLNLLAATAGGQLTRARAFVERFANAAPQAELVVLKVAGVMPDLVTASGIEVLEVPIGNGRTKALRRMLWENTAMIHLIRRSTPDVYLTFSHYLPSRNIGIPAVVAVSNLAPFSSDAFAVEGLAARLRLAILRRTIISSARRAQAVIALSQTCRKLLIEHGVLSSKIEVIPNGVHKLSPPERTIHARPNDDHYILSVSHFYRYKNFEQLLYGYARLSTEMRNRYRLKIIGKFYDQGYAAELRNLACRLEIDSRVDFIPGLDPIKLSLAYRHASLFIFTSLIENSPNILLEAMAHGLPTLSIDIDPMPEFGGRAIEYFKPRDHIDLAGKMEALLKDSIALDELSYLAQRQASQFSWDAFAKNVAALCVKVSETQCP